MKVRKRSSKALRILLRFSVFLAAKKKVSVAPKDADQLVMIAATATKITPKRYKQLAQLERKYLPREA